MSDYIPHPDTEMHINQMPEECLRLLFIQLPLPDQLKAGNVCQLWRTVRDALFRAQKSLTIDIDDYPYTIKNYLTAVGLNEERTAFLVAMFPRLSQLTIFITNRVLFDESSQVAHLLAQYRHQLVTLKLQSEYSPSWKGTPSGTVLFDAINAMSKLKQLSLGFFYLDRYEGQILAPFDLPILRQLDKLDFHCYNMSPSIITLWAPHLEARLTPMKISLNVSEQIDHSSAFYDSITPKVASMFTGFIKFEVNLEQFQRLSTRFTNLTRLSLTYFGDANTNSFAVPALMQALTNLKHLTTLCIETYPHRLDGQPSHGSRLPQLPTIKELYLYLNGNLENAYSHALLPPWTVNLSWFIPNLADLSINLYSFTGCTDCGFNCSIEDEDEDEDQDQDQDQESYCDEVDTKITKANDCLRQQLRHIKQQCPKLSKAKIEYDYRKDASSLYLEVKCTLEDLAD